MAEPQRKPHARAQATTKERTEAPVIELIYNIEVMEGRRFRLGLTHEDIRAMARSIRPMSRPTVAAVLAGNPHTQVGYVKAVLDVLGLTWRDVVVESSKQVAVA